MPFQPSRRQFLKKSGALVVAGSAPLWAPADPGPHRLPLLRFGLFTDPHYADRDAYGTRYYRQSIPKLNECIDYMNTQNLAFVIETGDFKDERPSRVEEETLSFLRDIESVFSRFEGPRYHVLGNHDIDSISKAQFQEVVENTGISRDRTFYGFDTGGCHCIVLDANFRSDGVPYDRGNFTWTDANISAGQLEWLRDELWSTRKPILVFCHQLLTDTEKLGVRNAPAVREILETRKDRVHAVFHGHKHEGEHQVINGIHYYTHKAMVEGDGPGQNAYSVIELYRDGTLQITGYRQADSHTFNTAVS